MIYPKGEEPFADFASMLFDLNQPLQLNGFKKWLLYPGMAFGATQKWWGDFGTRDFPHEGIDFCLYEGVNGQIFHFEQGSVIPVIAEGVVRAVFKDYLGHAIVVEHGPWPGSEKTLLSVYAHTDPYPHIQTDVRLQKGESIATTADTRNAKARILSHLHFTLGLGTSILSFENFYWNLMRAPEYVTLLDPLDITQIPNYQSEVSFPESFTSYA